jgi:MraZ protein
VYYGKSEHPLDDKGRFHMPVRILQEVEGNKKQFAITHGFDQCLFMFDDAGWQSMLTNVDADRVGGDELRDLHREFFANLDFVTPDKNRRVLIPEEHRKWAGLFGQPQVLVLGVNRRIELWSEAAWQERSARIDPVKQKVFTNQILNGVSPRLPG